MNWLTAAKYEIETSHLCLTRSCVNHKHCCHESHQANVARTTRGGCAGWTLLIDEKGKARLICECEHTPKCKTLHKIDLRSQGSCDRKLVWPASP
jgi:hypothetical protein